MDKSYWTQINDSYKKFKKMYIVDTSGEFAGKSNNYRFKICIRSNKTCESKLRYIGN